MRNSDTRPSVLTKSFGPLRTGGDPREQITLFICRTGRATAERSSSFLGDENAWFMTQGTRDCTPIPSLSLSLSPMQRPYPSLSLFLPLALSLSIFNCLFCSQNPPLFVTSKPPSEMCYPETVRGNSIRTSLREREREIWIRSLEV